MITGRVFDIRRYAIHDGPGIRTAVFLQGCPLACTWCHNPEGCLDAPQLMFRPARCVLCWECLEVCPNDAITRKDEAIHIDRARCRVSGECAAACPAEALEIVGREMPVEAVLAEVETDKVFYQQSGGGVTFTGGEPLAQPRFLQALLSACRKEGISTAVDTCGFAPWEIFERLHSLVDLFLYDLKVMDDTRHRKATGVSIAGILANLRKLSRAGASIIIRIPLVPGVNDRPQDLHDMGQFLASLAHVPPVELLPYHAIAAAKYAGLGRSYELQGLQPPDRETVETAAAALSRHGLQVKV